MKDENISSYTLDEIERQIHLSGVDHANQDFTPRHFQQDRRR